VSGKAVIVDPLETFPEFLAKLGHLHDCTVLTAAWYPTEYKLAGLAAPPKAGNHANDATDSRTVRMKSADSRWFGTSPRASRGCRRCAAPAR
jgi:hypothetical protein